MTTSVDTEPISYKEDEYKEMNELAFKPKGGQNTNTPQSQGSMTLDELNISNIGSENNTNDQLDDSGFAQNPDEDWEEQMNLLLQQNNQGNNNYFEDTNPLSDEEAYTDIESYPSFGSQNTTLSFPSSDISSITASSDISMGGKKKKRISRKKRRDIKKRKTINKRYKK